MADQSDKGTTMESMENTANQKGPVIIDCEEEIEVQNQRPGCKVQCVRCIQFTLQVLFSYVGLTAIMVGYLMLGTVIFQAIELPAEIRLRRDMKEMKIDFFDRLYLESRGKDLKNWTDEAFDLLNDMERDTKHYFTYDERDTSNSWEFFGTLLFSLTTVSMIGKYPTILIKCTSYLVDNTFMNVGKLLGAKIFGKRSISKPGCGRSS